MQLQYFYLLLVLFSFFGTTHVQSTQKPWTFLVYIAGANDLNSFVDLDLAEMIDVGSNENVNVVVFETIHRDGQAKETNFMYVQQGSLVKIGNEVPQDSGSIETLKHALELAITLYPSDKMCVVLWDHGSGPLNRSITSAVRGVCYDFDTNHYLTDIDCLNALSWAQNTLRGGKKFDIVAFDACLMAGIEIAYTLSNCANYLVASQETIPGTGFDYNGILSNFISRAPSARDFALGCVTAYGQAYANQSDITLSATDLSQVGNCVSQANNLAQVLFNLLKSKQKSAVKRYIIRAINNSISFDDGIYVDLENFCSYLQQYASKMGLASKDKNTLIAATQAVKTALTKAVIAKTAGKFYRGASGLSIYLPTYSIDRSYANLYWTQQNAIWLKLLNAYTA